MPLVLNLPPDLEKELSVEAERFSLSLAEYVLRVLSSRSPEWRPLINGAELVSYWEREGLIGSRPDLACDSPDHVRALRTDAERRTRN